MLYPFFECNCLTVRYGVLSEIQDWYSEVKFILKLHVIYHMFHYAYTLNNVMQGCGILFFP